MYLPVRRTRWQRGEGEGGRGGHKVRGVGEQVGQADLLLLVLLLVLQLPGALVHGETPGLLHRTEVTEKGRIFKKKKAVNMDIFYFLLLSLSVKMEL